MATETSSCEHSSLSRVVLLATLSHDQLVLIVVSLILFLRLLVALSHAAMILKLLLDLGVIGTLPMRLLLLNLLLASRLANGRRYVLEILALCCYKLQLVLIVLNREGLLLLLDLSLLLSENPAVLAVLAADGDLPHDNALEEVTDNRIDDYHDQGGEAEVHAHIRLEVHQVHYEFVVSYDNEGVD